MTRPTLEVADVVRQYGAAYLARYGATVSPEQHRALRAIAVCRTAALGGHATQCDQCGHLEITYNSCGNRHCPKCPGRAQAAWLAAREAALLDVPYVHVVFPLPHLLSAVQESPDPRLPPVWRVCPGGPPALALPVGFSPGSARHARGSTSTRRRG